MLDVIREKFENLKIEFVKLHMQRNYKDKIEALGILKILIDEITSMISDEKEEYIFFYQIVLARLELVIKTAYELLYLSDAKNLVEYLEEKEEVILWILYDLLEEEEEQQETVFIEQIEKVETIIDEYNLRKEKKL